MKKLYPICLLTFCLLLSVAGLQAQEFRRTDPLLLDYFWGEDVILAAPLEFASTSFFAGNPEAWDGVMFPLYLGYLSFCDENSAKQLVFTPAPGYDFALIADLFEIINANGGLEVGFDLVALDWYMFCSILIEELHRMGDIYAIGAMPIGTAKDFDFSFTDQTEFVWQAGQSRFRHRLGLGEIFEKFDSLLENLVVKPKE